MTFVTRYGPPVLMMGLIFFLSAQPNLGPELGFWEILLRKSAHVTEYFLLTLLWLRALRREDFAAAAALAYACTDEYHQTFVFGRHGTPVDVLIDSIGITLAILVARAVKARHDGRRLLQA